MRSVLARSMSLSGKLNLDEAINQLNQRSPEMNGMINTPIESDEYTLKTEDSFEVIKKLRELLSSSKLDSVRIIFEERTNIEEVRRKISTIGVVDHTMKLLYKNYIYNYEKYVSDLSCLISSQHQIISNITSIDSFRSQRIFDINGNPIVYSTLSEDKEMKKKLKLLIFYEDIDTVNMEDVISLAKLYFEKLLIFVVSKLDNFIEKKEKLLDKRYYRNIDKNTSIKDSFINKHITYLFDKDFLVNKYFCDRYPWCVILDKDDTILYQNDLTSMELKPVIKNYLSPNPKSLKNLDNLFWVDLPNSIKLNLVRDFNLKLQSNGFKYVYFRVETYAIIAKENLLSTFDINAIFSGYVKDERELKSLREFGDKLCESKDISNVQYKIEIDKSMS